MDKDLWNDNRLPKLDVGVIEVASGQQSQDSKNPFAPLEGTKGPSESVRKGNETSNIPDSQPVVDTTVFQLNYANAKDIEKIITGLVSSGGKVSVDERLNIIMVRDTAENVAQIKRILETLDVEGPQLMPVIGTTVFRLNYANAKKLENAIKALVSSDGKVGVDERLNSIIVRDTVENLAEIKQVLKKLDVKAPQVMIEVLIVNVKLTDELKMGVDWTKLGTSSVFFSQGLSVTGSVNPYGKLTFLTTPGNWSIDGLIDFIQTNKDVRILANPKVLVLNNQTAMIKTVEEIPYQELSETAAGGSIGTTAFKEAGVTLEVTPQITDDGHIIMNIKPEQSALIDTIIVENSEIPVIETRKTDTILRVKDGQTIIIGGLRRKDPTVEESKVPILGDIPLIGGLFRKTRTKQTESELGVFITPHIYTDGKLTAEDSKLLHSNDKKKYVFDASDLLRLQSNK